VGASPFSFNPSNTPPETLDSPQADSAADHRAAWWQACPSHSCTLILPEQHTVKIVACHRCSCTRDGCQRQDALCADDRGEVVTLVCSAVCTTRGHAPQGLLPASAKQRASDPAFWQAEITRSSEPEGYPQGGAKTSPDVPRKQWGMAGGYGSLGPPVSPLKSQR